MYIYICMYLYIYVERERAPLPRPGAGARRTGRRGPRCRAHRCSPGRRTGCPADRSL